MIHVKTDEMYGANPIVNSNDLRTFIINIDSRFRKTQLEPPTDFQYDFAHPYKNVIRARVASVEIPTVFYNFSNSKKNTMFRLDATDYMGTLHHLTITIPEGNYTASSLITTIQEELDGIRDMYGLFFRITYDKRTNKVTLQHDGCGAPPCPVGPSHRPMDFGLFFSMVGLEDRKYDNGLGSNLGFTEPFYMVAMNCITGETPLSTAGDPYFLLAIEELYTVEHKTENTYIQCLAKILVKKPYDQTMVFDDGYTVLSNEFLFPRPTDLRQVRVRLLDRYGVPIDLHHANLSLSLEITEVMNVQLYDSYRNYIWEKGDPSIKGTGSVMTQAGKRFN
jgi:hypothetical protein